MKPTRAQYFWAEAWPVQVLLLPWFFGLPLFSSYVTVRLLTPVYQPLSHISNLLRLVFYGVVALLLGFLVAIVAASLLAGLLWPVFRPIYHSRCARNGAPFQVGDRVRILAGRHRDKIVRVYQPWADDSVRVELGEAEKARFRDIFSAIQLCKE